MVGKYFEDRRDSRQKVLIKRTEIYERFFDFNHKLFFNEKLGRPPVDEAEILKFLTDFHRDIVLWGSDNVIRAFIGYRAALEAFRLHADPQLAAEALAISFNAIATLQLAMRRDVGHPWTRIKTPDLARAFFANPTTDPQIANLIEILDRHGRGR